MNHSIEECVREKQPAPEGVTVHAVKDHEGRLLGHMIVIGSLEVVTSLAPFLQIFGLDPEGIARVLALAVFTSPAVVPVMLFVDSVGSLSLIKIEDVIRQHLHKATKPADPI